MKKNINDKFSFLIASIPELDYPVIEISFEEEVFAEIRYERGFQVLFFPSAKGKRWDFSFEEIVDVLTHAKDHLGIPSEAPN